MGHVGDFERFFETEYEPVVRSLTLAFGDRHTAEDCAQVGFERALRRWRSVGALDRPGTWVYVVAVRHGRRQLARDRLEAAPNRLEHPDPETSVVDQLWVAALVAALPPRQRAAVVLRHAAGLQVKEIARALGVTDGTVKASLHAAYRSLRLEVAEEPDHTPTEEALTVKPHRGTSDATA